MEENTAFRFRVSTNLRYGIGESEKLGEEITERGYTKVAAIVDQGVFEHPQVRRALESVRQAGISLDIFKSTAVEPTYDYLECFKKSLVGKEYDCLVAIGGGSAIDLTKGLAVLLTNEGEAISFRGFPKLKRNLLPIIAIPTTAGTGSESTYPAVFTDSREKRKFGINSMLNFPVCSIIDPLITVDCPRSVTISSGMDALVHSLESYVANSATPISKIFSREAFSLVFNTLPRAVDEPSNLEWRGRMQLGAYYAGIALMNSGAGPAGALSYPLGVRFQVPHGLAGAVFLPEVVSLNIELGCLLYADLYDLMEGAKIDINAQEKCVKFCNRLRDLCDKLGVPRTLRTYRVSPEDIPVLAKEAMWQKGAMEQNPVRFSTEEAKLVLERMLQP